MSTILNILLFLFYAFVVYEVIVVMCTIGVMGMVYNHKGWDFNTFKKSWFKHPSGIWYWIVIGQALPFLAVCFIVAFFLTKFSGSMVLLKQKIRSVL